MTVSVESKSAIIMGVPIQLFYLPPIAPPDGGGEESSLESLVLLPEEQI